MIKRGKTIMKRKHFTKIAASAACFAMFAASMAIPAANSLTAPATSYAATPFIADTDYNGAINIDESQIKVTCKRYYPGGKNIKAAVSGTSVKTSSTVTSVPVLSRSIISMEVSGTGLTQEKAEKATLDVTYHIDGRKNSWTYSSPNVRKGSASNSYILDFDVITHGNSFEYSTSSFSGVKNLKCVSSCISPQSNSGNYYQIEAKTPNGENIFISSKYPGNYSTNMEKWAKKLCMYANSLSDVTGVKLGTVYICFDDPDADAYAWAYSANWYMNETMDRLGFIALSKNSSDVELDFAANKPDVMTWTLMHEIAHSYAIGCKPSNFDGFRFNDEYLTNVRGLTAIQNCDNLKKLKINLNEHYATYDKIFAQMNCSVNTDPCGFHATKLVEIGNQYGWDKLEKYFRAESDYNYERPENIAAAGTLADHLGITGKSKDKLLKNADYLKYVNSCRKLMQLCWNHYNDNSFIAFVDQHFTKTGVINTLKNINVL